MTFVLVLYRRTLKYLIKARHHYSQLPPKPAEKQPTHLETQPAGPLWDAPCSLRGTTWPASTARSTELPAQIHIEMYAYTGSPPYPDVLPLILEHLLHQWCLPATPEVSSHLSQVVLDLILFLLPMALRPQPGSLLSHLCFTAPSLATVKWCRFLPGSTAACHALPLFSIPGVRSLSVDLLLLTSGISRTDEVGFLLACFLLASSLLLLPPLWASWAPEHMEISRAGQSVVCCPDKKVESHICPADHTGSNSPMWSNIPAATVFTLCSSISPLRLWALPCWWYTVIYFSNVRQEKPV